MINNLDYFIEQNTKEWIKWRHHLHANPETAFEEFETSKFVIKRLESFGVEVYKGLATTGVVGVLRSGSSNTSIALRADMDALDIEEKTNLQYASTIKGKMHACGHDGHTTMLLAAAQYLAQEPGFNGTIYFIFQPAEENLAGGKVMIDEGLFEKFNADSVFGMHNWPNIDVGVFATRNGPLMASNDIFEIVITGKSSHAAMPEQSIDPIVIGSNIVNNLQSITSRNVNPLESAVVSVTQIFSGSAWNVIPDTCTIRGTVRAFNNTIRDKLQQRIDNIATMTAKAYNGDIKIDYQRMYCPTVNHKTETRIAIDVAAQLVGDNNVYSDVMPTMAAEDFGYMLEKKPGNFMWIGNGASQALHNNKYDFNDDIIPFGVKYWVCLVNRLIG